MEKENRVITSKELLEDSSEKSLRPSNLQDFIGQNHALNNLKVFIKSAISRKKVLDHVLLCGPPGLGKTSIAQIISKELGVNFRATSGPVISKAGDLAAILTNLKQNDILFIDEIHRLNSTVEEILYPAMEDFKLDLIIGEGPAARSIRINLPPFTLVAATTRTGLITSPLRDRFGIPLRLYFYNVSELKQVVLRAANILKIKITSEAASIIASRSRGTPRICERLLRRVRDFAYVANTNNINEKIANLALNKLDIDANGLDAMDRRYLTYVAEFYAGGPVGIETISAALSEQKDVLEEVVEPYLIQKGFLQRTPRGRILTALAYKHINIHSKQQVQLKKKNV